MHRAKPFKASLRMFAWGINLHLYVSLSPPRGQWNVRQPDGMLRTNTVHTWPKQPFDWILTKIQSSASPTHCYRTCPPLRIPYDNRTPSRGLCIRVSIMPTRGLSVVKDVVRLLHLCEKYSGYAHEWSHRVTSKSQRMASRIDQSTGSLFGTQASIWSRHKRQRHN